jgi:hypothetical protein
MKRVYTRPDLVEYGRMAQLTLGGSGSKTDYVWDGVNFATISIDGSAPSCTNNAGPSGVCLHVAS